MNEDTRRARADEADQDIRQLLALAGPRLQPPADMQSRVRAATLAAVAELPEPVAQQDRRPGRILAFAAALLLAVGAGFLFSRLPEEASPAAAGEVVYATGGYTVRGSESGSSSLMAGSIVQTSREGRLLVALTGDRTIRIDHGSSLTLHSPAEVWLHSGRIYVDAPGEESMTVVTPYAAVTDVGTQFEVSVVGDALEVATRTGRVDVALGDRTVRSQAVPGTGEHLVINGLTLTSRSPISTMGARWQWTQDARPLFPVRDRSVSEFLEWAARESGRSLIYASELVEQQAELRRLAGRGAVDADPDSVRRVLLATAFRALDGAPHELKVGLDSG
ncbi:MAG: FecR domain-containing protein [Gammaproteobacteria bacterium]